VLNRVSGSLGLKRAVLDISPHEKLKLLLAQDAEDTQEADQDEEAEGAGNGDG